MRRSRLLKACKRRMSKKGKRRTVNYILGHSQRAVQRLIYQAAILRPITERLLRSVKLESGMRVLDYTGTEGHASRGRCPKRRIVRRFYDWSLLGKEGGKRYR